MSEWQNALVAGSCLATSFLVNAASSSLRASWWNGGSEEIGGEPVSYTHLTLPTN